MESQNDTCLDCLAKDCRIRQLEQRIEAYKDAMASLQFALDDATAKIQGSYTDDDTVELRLYPIDGEDIEQG